MSIFRMRTGFEVARVAALLLVLTLVLSPLDSQILRAEDARGDEYLVDVIEDDDGNLIDVRICPLPPPDRRTILAAEAPGDVPGTAIVLPDVPAFDWSYGCSATSAAMLFGYYDRTGYPNMYSGPTNGGVCPPDNSVWVSESPLVAECPLSATHEGYDGLAVKGHVDDYWVSYGSTSDPYYGNWTQHDYADCTADYMGTSQYQNWGNVDGSTSFFFYTNGEPLYDYSDSELVSPPSRDGCHGMRLFAESRGYSVVKNSDGTYINYNQYISVSGDPSAGFTFAQYMQEIDDGRPVLIQVDGHTMLGFGYDVSSQLVYLHNTWNYGYDTMTWGGQYLGMQHYGVTILELEPPAPLPEVQTVAADSVEETTATLHGTLVDDGGETCQYRFSYGTVSGDYAEQTTWTGSVIAGQSFSEGVVDLAIGQSYYYVAQAKNGGGISSGAELSFVTKPGAPTDLASTALGTHSIELSWAAGPGATRTGVYRKAGSDFVDRGDGTQVYYGSGLTFIDSGLSPGTDYYYRAWSFEDDGSQWSNDSADTTATTDPVTVSVSDAWLASDSTGPVQVTIAGAVGLAAATISLQFDPLVAELTTVESGLLGSVTHNAIGDANTSGILTMSWSDASGHTGDFLFATLTFHSVATPPAERPLDLTVDNFDDLVGDSIAVTGEDGILRVLGLMEGDVNLDLSTNIVDAMFIAQYTVGLRTLDATQLLSGDTTDDGQVNIVDAMHIAQYTVDPTGSGHVLFKPLWQSPEDDDLLPPA